MTKIQVVIKNGSVKFIEDIPTDVTVEVRNYDVKELLETELSKDENGTPCYIKEWHAPE